MCIVDMQILGHRVNGGSRQRRRAPRSLATRRRNCPHALTESSHDLHSLLPSWGMGKQAKQPITLGWTAKTTTRNVVRCSSPSSIYHPTNKTKQYCHYR
ncbi:unnamed protein product [Periconia digitata]|uniref:Uncharacterized protein n=1 Tax=Periconia digitata TaxID=1303443 RepID=A0A9W4XQ71_9PLEO|nr:unnamed protein product [Periconia digitata]